MRALPHFIRRFNCMYSNLGSKAQRVPGRGGKGTCQACRQELLCPASPQNEERGDQNQFRPVLFHRNCSLNQSRPHARSFRKCWEDSGEHTVTMSEYQEQRPVLQELLVGSGGGDGNGVLTCSSRLLQSHVQQLR